jgi:hypothetical protein
MLLGLPSHGRSLAYGKQISYPLSLVHHGLCNAEVRRYPQNRERTYSHGIMPHISWRYLVQVIGFGNAVDPEEMLKLNAATGHCGGAYLTSAS